MYFFLILSTKHVKRIDLEEMALSLNLIIALLVMRNAYQLQTNAHLEIVKIFEIPVLLQCLIK